MGFLKKNLLFCIVVVICTAALIVGAVMSFSAAGKVNEARRDLNTAENQLENLVRANPAPTVENLEAAEQNRAELQATLAQIREELQQGASLSTSSDGVSVMAGVQQYIAKFQKLAANHTDEAGAAAPIQTPNNFAFGYEQYVDEASMLQDAEKVSLLDKQRQILAYLLTELIESGPQSIDVVRREFLERDMPPAGNQNKSTFSIDPAVSARVPGAIDTLAFSITFRGYTDALREFLNRLAQFELPIVVRSVEVERPSGSETVVAPPRRNEPEDIFARFGGEESEAQPDRNEGQGPVPVIEENISEFTVLLEFIEVVLPETQTQEDSDPA